MFSDNTAAAEVSQLITFYLEGWQLEYENGVRQQTIIDSQREIIREQAKIIEAQERALATDERRIAILKLTEAGNDES